MALTAKYILLIPNQIKLDLFIKIIYRAFESLKKKKINIFLLILLNHYQMTSICFQLDPINAKEKMILQFIAFGLQFLIFCYLKMEQQKNPVDYGNGGVKHIKEKKATDRTALQNTINQAQSGCKAKLFQPAAVAQLQHQLKHQVHLQQAKSTNIDTIRKCVGVLRTNWYNRTSKRLVSFIYGTAFLVEQNVLMTCTHNVFSASRKNFADQLIFVPNVENGSISSKQTKTRRVKYDLSNSVYSIFDTEIRWQLKTQVQFQINPTKYEICLITLDPCENAQKLSSYIPIGRWKYDLDNPQPLAIFGYPSESYKSIANFKQIKVQRQERWGAAYSIESYQTKNTNREDWQKDSTINYKIDTEIGFSGSPILVLGKDNNYYAVGIHTHRGKQYFRYRYNSGVFFNDFIPTIKCLVDKMPAETDIIYKQCTQIMKKEEVPREIKEESREDLEEYSLSEIAEQSSSSSCSSKPPQDDDGQVNSSMQNFYDDNDSVNSQMSNLDGIYEYFTLIREPFDPCSTSYQQSTPTFFISSIEKPLLLSGSDLIGQTRHWEMRERASMSS